MSTEIEMKSIEVEMPSKEAEPQSNEQSEKPSTPPVTNDMDLKELSPPVEIEQDYQPEETMNSFGVFLFCFLSLACNEYYERNCWNWLFGPSCGSEECMRFFRLLYRLVLFGLLFFLLWYQRGTSWLLTN